MRKIYDVHMRLDDLQFIHFSTNRGELIAAFQPSSKQIWKEESTTENIRPEKLKNGWEYMPWGNDNQMPYDILEKIEEDETINTCQQHVIKNCYAAGLEYVIPEDATEAVTKDVKDFCMRNDLSSYYLGVCTDMKFWQFAVTLVTLNRAGNKIASLKRLQAMYCRFSPDNGGRRYVYYAQWRNSTKPDPKDVQRFPLLDIDDPFTDLKELMAGTSERKRSGEVSFAIVIRIPTPDNTYYPIPYYASLFKGKWYDIKRLIAIGKYSKLKNAAPLKYIITISPEFWTEQFELAGITDNDEKQAEFVNKKKTEIIDFLTGAENSGRAIFTGAYLDPGTGKLCPHITITNLEHDKEGGDWESDNVEAMTMVCFVMGVHPNLVGAVPGKTQSNNSGSDKRELYMIVQLLNKPTHDLLKRPHQLVCYINGWEGVHAECQIMQLTTLDEHKDVKPTKDNGQENEDNQ